MDKLYKVVDEFADAMKKRLIQKGENEHFTGWDSKKRFSQSHFIWEIFDRAVRLIRDPKMFAGKWLIDIANYAMFVWYRNGKSYD